VACRSGVDGAWLGDISGLNPWLGPSAGSRAQMVLWAPPCQLKLGLLLSWGRRVELSSWGELAGCRWSRARAGVAGAGSAEAYCFGAAGA
jgi:hypothetical protein